MKSLVCILAAMAVGACTDPPPPKDVSVTWSLDQDVTVGDYCTGVVVDIAQGARPIENHKLGCDATSAVVTLDPETADVDVRYTYWEIPTDCDSQACWRENWFAIGSATYDGASDLLLITVHSTRP